MAVYDNVTGKRLAFLENAYNIGYTLNLNKLDQATFSLPVNDPKTKYCQPYRFVDIWDQDEFIGKFRILPSVQTRNSGQQDIVYTLESVLATLMDDILFGWHEIGNLGVFTQQVLSYVLSMQTIHRWELAACGFTHQYLYGWENENLLSALFSVPTPFVENYVWKYNTMGAGTPASPWQLSLVVPDETPKSIIQYQRNLSGIVKNIDPTDLCTRLYPLGYGEGVNQLNITSINNGSYYLDSPNQDAYGIISRIWTDRRYEDVNSLYSAAVAMLDELSQPYVTYSVEVTQNNLTNSLNIGDFVRVIDDEDGTDFNAQIIAKSKTDVIGNNPAIQITLANKARNVATSVADLADRQRINEVYSQGAVTVFTKSFADNADSSHPAELLFEFPDNMVHINEVSIYVDTSSFRGYTQAVEGGGETSTTTGGGGATSQTTESGGESSQTSEAVVLPAEYGISDDSTTEGALHNHGINSGVRLATVSKKGSTTVTGDVGWVPSGAHSHGAHSHEFESPSHTHSFSLNDHTHSISIPDHTHEIAYGIYEGPSVQEFTLVVDGTEVNNFSSLSSYNIVPYLNKDNEGKINRSSHTVQIVPVPTQDNPNGLARVEINMMVQLFANSRGGGQY